MPEVVYRSTHPEALTHWEKTSSDEAHAAWREQVNTVIADLGFPGRRFATSKSWRGVKPIGIEHPTDQHIPEGWRRDRDLPEAIVPDRRTKTGKQIGKRLDALPAPNPRAGMPGGMPGVAFSARGHEFLRCGLGRYGDAVYVSWSSELSEKDTSRIDPAVWEQAKLSEYYAAIEAEAVKA